MDKIHYLFILVAASSVGKSDLIKTMKAEGLWDTVPKYSTRDNRNIEDDVVRITSDEIREAESKNSPNDIRAARMKYIKEVCGEGCGVVYYKNNNIYGVRTNDIIEKLKYSHLAVVISDFHAIKRLKDIKELKEYVKVIYIGSTVDEKELLKRYKIREDIEFDISSNDTEMTIRSIQDMCSLLSSALRLKYLSKIEEVLPLLNEQWNSYVPYYETIKTRAINIRMLYNRYIDYIADIDYPILNFYDQEYMYEQGRNIIKNISKRRNVKAPPIFMVCAAPSSGKATLMEIVGNLGEVNNNIAITTKYAKRNSRITDGRDGMMAIGKDGSFSEYISNEESIWKWVFHKGTEYAVSHDEIKDNLNKNIAQIFISNMTQIERAREYYPDNIVILYLHATHETATKKHIEAKRKSEIIDQIQKKYLELDTKLDEQLENEVFHNDAFYQDKFHDAVNRDLQEIREVHNSYLDHNYEIDHVLLNTGTREDLVEQMINLINYYTK